MADVVLSDDYPTVLAGLKQRGGRRDATLNGKSTPGSSNSTGKSDECSFIRQAERNGATSDGTTGRRPTSRRFPGLQELSVRNLLCMRSFARAWGELDDIAQQPVAQLSWGHITVLLDKIADYEQRDWYADQAVTHGWTRAVLEHHVKTARRVLMHSFL